MNPWHEQPLESFLGLITYGFTNPMPTTTSGPFMVTAKDINYGRILYDQARSTSDEAFRNRLTDKSRPEVGDVLVTKDGTLGRIAVVDRPGICINQSVALLRPNEKIRPRFLKYLLEEPKNFARIIADADGSTIKHIYITRLAKMAVCVPALPIQDKILEVVGSLDDRIELNRQMNETLEAMAQAIFRDWFIDFGPVSRKLAGETEPVAIMGGLTRESARAAELAVLFPAEFDGGGLPQGWIERPLDQIAEFLNGLALQKFPAVDGEPSLPVIKIAELRNGLSEKSNRASPQLPDKYIVRDGDYLFSWSGSLMAKVWTEGDGALNQHLFKVSSASYPQWFYAAWVEHHLPEFKQIAASKATTMGHIQRGHLTSAMTVCPPQTILNAMATVLEPLWDRRVMNDLENRTLAETRDYLLPRLLSGEVRVGDIDLAV